MSTELYREAALESARISGYEFAWNETVDEDDTFKRHVELMEAVLNPHGRKLIHPLILNMNLHSDRVTRWRTGIPGAMEHLLPEGRFTKWLLLYWWNRLTYNHRKLRDAPPEAQDRFTWEMHDFFLCLQPFVRGNGRTARLVRHNVRQAFGLPVQLIRHEKAEEYYRHVTEYRTVTFIPIMKKHGYIK